MTKIDLNMQTLFQNETLIEKIDFLIQVACSHPSSKIEYIDEEEDRTLIAHSFAAL